MFVCLRTDLHLEYCGVLSLKLDMCYVNLLPNNNIMYNMCTLYIDRS